ncbi:MAG: hypothetical protein ABJC09_12990 [Terriglobia bacterium]
MRFEHGAEFGLLVLKLAALGLELLQLGFVTVERALNTHFISAEEFEVGLPAKEGAGLRGGYLFVDWRGAEFGRRVGVGTGEDAVFDVATPVQTPIIGGYGEGELRFERVGWFEATDDAVAEFVVVGAVRKSSSISGNWVGFSLLSSIVFLRLDASIGNS